MQLITKKILSLNLWNLFDVQFGNMLANTAHIYDYKNQQYKKKSALMFASAYLSSIVRVGNTCLPISLLTADQLFQNRYPQLTSAISQTLGKLSTDDWQDLLLSTSAVGDGSQSTPLVLDDKCLYLYRLWQDECIVARFFNYPYNNKDLNTFQNTQIISILNQLFPKITNQTINWQKIATAISLTHPRTIISGGPGTGKTTIIHKIITALLSYNHNLRIKIATPTGKAATVLTNSCQKMLYNQNQLNNVQKYTEASTATTLHRLLGARLYQTNNNTYNYFNLDTLDIDYLIIDEASMVSLSILSKLILSLPNTIKTVFLGDHNQLHSIEPGSVFQDICQFANTNYSFDQRKKLTLFTGYILTTLNNSKLQYNYNNVSDGICILKKNYRFNKTSGIGQLAKAVKLSNHNRVLSILTSNIYTDLYYNQIKTHEHYITMIIDCATKYSRYLKKIQQYKISIIDILQTFHNYRILCALHHGPFGIIKINYYVEQILNNTGLITLNKSTNYIGKPIIILNNNPSLGLFNGDIGILLPNHQNHLSAYFLLPQHNIKMIHIHQLPPHETCFAMTIHKAQGSEFQCVSIILPNQPKPILTKELLYTSITRAHQKLFLYSNNEVLIHSIHTNTTRYSGLYNKIKKDIQQKQIHNIG